MYRNASIFGQVFVLLPVGFVPIPAWVWVQVCTHEVEMKPIP